ncbi:MAG: HutD family protein [Betaproteobacteria bacterium]
MVRLLAPDDYRSMPWKDGGGRTTEIAVRPAGAALDDFAWRVSIADVDHDGPFSRFSGIDRTIVLLEGAGMRFRGGAREIELRTPFEPYSFAGEETVDCQLVDGAIRDFNAMFRRGRARGTLDALRGDGARIAAAEVRLVYAAKGAHECIVAGHPPMSLPMGHTLIVEPPVGDEAAPIAIRPLTPHGVALVVCVECR